MTDTMARAHHAVLVAVRDGVLPNTAALLLEKALREIEDAERVSSVEQETADL